MMNLFNNITIEKMWHLYVKTLQLILLTFTTSATTDLYSFISIILLLIAAMLPKKRVYVGSASALFLSVLLLFSNFSILGLGLALGNAGLCFILIVLDRDKGKSVGGQDRGVKFLFLVCVALSTLTVNEVASTSLLGLFIGMLIVEYLEWDGFFNAGAKIYRVILPLQLLWSGCGFLLSEQQILGHLRADFGERRLWYFCSLVLGTYYATSMANWGQIGNVYQKGQSDGGGVVEIQLRELSGKSLSVDLQEGRAGDNFDGEQEGKVSSGNAMMGQNVALEQGRRERGGEKGAGEEKADQQPNLERRQSKKEQRDSLNLLLTIPFCILNHSWLQIPLLAYILAIQWNRHLKFLTVGMLLAVGVSIYLQNDDEGQSLFQKVGLRVLAACLVEKQLQIGSFIGVTVRSLWLRSSFAIVLIFLFWFSLLTVNIFHLLFIVVVLLFTIKNQPEQRHSYRHRNWKYLQILFNLFLILRVVYVIAREMLGGNYSPFIASLLAITGISFNYASDVQLFNLVPLLINAAIGFQYLTYTSTIYQTDTRRTFMGTYRQTLEKIGVFLTIVYYKLLPWMSYCVLLGLLLSYDFSGGSGILLGWLLVTFAVHVGSRHDLGGYRRMDFLWLGFMRLTSLQIVLRFAFEFSKFQMFNFLRTLPFFTFLLRYQQLLGLAIPQQEAVYLKTITKFQLMMSLDFSSIFIAFLVRQYYLLLINYLQLPEESDRNQSDKKTAQAYNKFIDFKIVSWLKKYTLFPMIRVSCTVFLELFFPFLGLMACIRPSIHAGLYLFLGLVYYLNLSLASYKIHVRNALMRRVLAAVIEWREGRLGRRGKQIGKSVEEAGRSIGKLKVKRHEELRMWIVGVSCLAIFLVHCSKGLAKADVVQLMGSRVVLTLRWWLYVGGCSVEVGITRHLSLLVLLLVVFDKKCCWFMGWLWLVRERQPELREEEQAEEVLGQREHAGDAELGEEIKEYSGGEEGREGREELEWESRSREDIYKEMKISLLFASVKLTERFVVMVLVFASLVEISHPFGMLYLLCAILLNYMGSLSIKTLSRILFLLIALQYSLLVINLTNPQLQEVPQQLQIFQERPFFNSLFNLPQEWQEYLTFGKSGREKAVMVISWVLMFTYPVYFQILRRAAGRVLELLQEDLQLRAVSQKVVEHIQQLYSYSLAYSPLVVMILCLGIYCFDYSVTNFILTILTTGFIFVSFMVREYRDSRQVWRSYFFILQLMIVFFMLAFTLLQIPMLSDYCHGILCTSQQFHNQLSKALLLLILQIGLDLTKSHHFDRALKHLAHSRYRADLQRIVLAQRQNDRKILQHFKRARREEKNSESVRELELFLQKLKEDPQQQFGWKGQTYEAQGSWLEFILDFLPEIVDRYLLLSEREIRKKIEGDNWRWIEVMNIQKTRLNEIHDSYLDEFGYLDQESLLLKIQGKLEEDVVLTDKEPPPPAEQTPSQRQQSQHKIRDRSRVSFLQQSLPLDSQESKQNLRGEVSRKGEKLTLLALLVAESIYSNWQYIVYCLLVGVHLSNLGLLTLPIPFVIFFCGLPSSERAGKKVWRSLLLLLMLPILFKFGVTTRLISCSGELQFLLIGERDEAANSSFLQFAGILCIIGECVVLKLNGLWQQSCQEIECMRMALVRNIINTQSQQQREELHRMLQKSEDIPTNFPEMTFGRSQLKAGKDYSTLLTSLQLCLMLWVFLFFDRMAVRPQVSFYRMIEYNQFSSGMVVLTLLQLLFLLAQRFVCISDLREWSGRWQLGLIFKYVLMLLSFCLMEGFGLLYFSLFSQKYQRNTYVTVMLMLTSMSLVVQALQIKNGMDRTSKGFMDRYTWYNGFVYLGYRAIPFLFEFKMFSDWTFTKTSLRIFDWIRLEQIFGRLFVAKCNALFLGGKKLGSKIEWWKKLLMGYPLLLSIILLLFGPLVLFSGLNPLASLNDIEGGYLEIVLRVNRSNQYPLYTNSHITDIRRLQPSEQQRALLRSYDIEPDIVQLLQLQSFSDQYWQISQGSYQKLLKEPSTSHFQFSVRARFDRELTGKTALYVLSSLPIPAERVDSLKQALQGRESFCVEDLVNPWIRLDNNNGWHMLGSERGQGCLSSKVGIRAAKQYWILEGGLQLRIASDKYTQAIFGYSVMSFYISIILVIANYFRFLFQGSAHQIILSDIPNPDPVLVLCNTVYASRRERDLKREEQLFWLLIDILRSPDTLKTVTGDYLDARIRTLQEKEE